MRIHNISPPEEISQKLKYISTPMKFQHKHMYFLPHFTPILWISYKDRRTNMLKHFILQHKLNLYAYIQNGDAPLWITWQIGKGTFSPTRRWKRARLWISALDAPQPDSIFYLCIIIMWTTYFWWFMACRWKHHNCLPTFFFKPHTTRKRGTNLLTVQL